MPPSMISPVSGAIPKVSGRRSATPMAAERPGIQPTTIPMVTPIIIMIRLDGMRALAKPADMSPNVFASMVFPPVIRILP